MGRTVMHAQTPKVSGASRIAVLALALLLASCIFDKSYNISGTVIGLTGTGLVLQNNGGDNLAVTANGPFTFSKAVKKGKGYNVTVLVQRAGQTCTVISGSGTANSNVGNVTVNCGGTYTVGGTVSGLTGAGLVLRNNGGNNLAVSANGAFTFSAPVAAGGAYSVTVLTQPSGQNCTVSNGAGTSTTNVTSIAVACAGIGFTVGGAVSGLTGAGLVLQNNGGNNLPIAGSGPFTFSTALANAAAYGVTVLTPPAGQGCSVANGSGTISGANVTNVAVTCAAAPGAPAVNLTFGLKELQFSWGAAAGATFYRLLENPDGVSGYAQVASNISTTSYNHTIPVYRRLNASYIVEACNAGGCTGSQPQDVSGQLTQAIGYAKASNIVATSVGTGDQFGNAVAVSSDGNTLAVGAPNEASALTGVRAGSVDEATAGNGASFAGAVYVFARIAGVWTQQAYVKASNTAAFAFFGSAVALSGDGNTLAVGARGAEAAYVFTRTSGTWAQQALVTASNAEVGDMFGVSLALSGDGNTLAVGAPSEASSTTGVNTTADELAPSAGAVYVYTRSGAAWTQQAYVKASNAESGDIFGSAVALNGNGNTLAVGAPFESSGLTGVIPGAPGEGTTLNVSAMSGAAYVYLRSGTTWTQQAYVKASNTGDSDQFGTAVALSGDGNTLAVGAPVEEGSGFGASGVVGTVYDDAASNAGAAYVYGRSGSTWSAQTFVKASN